MIPLVWLNKIVVHRGVTGLDNVPFTPEYVEDYRYLGIA